MYSGQKQTQLFVNKDAFPQWIPIGFISHEGLKLISTGCAYSHPKLLAVVVVVLPSMSQICQRKAKPAGVLYKPSHSCIAAQRPTKPFSLYYSVPCFARWRSTARRRADDLIFCTATDDDPRHAVFICALNRIPRRKVFSSLQIVPQRTNSYSFFKVRNKFKP
jgi:hypothetical protein